MTGQTCKRKSKFQTETLPETFFASLTRRRLQRGAFYSLVDLQAAINRDLGEHNRKPNPLSGPANPDRIIEKANRGVKWSQTTSCRHEVVNFFYTYDRWSIAA
jgi:hypothetical protein